MRTLKKTLALVLAVVMVLGLAAISASAADFADADKITYKEAVDVLTGIGVIDGIEKGGVKSFEPQGELTRAQAAKILTYVLGYQDIKGTATFSDTQGHWAEGPIALCATEKIVNGIGDNKFDPEGKLTGSAWAKMLLCALGYNAEFEGMIGEAWEVNVAKTLKNTNIMTGIDGFDGTKNINRETACQMAFNALSEPTRIFKEGMKIDGNGISVSQNGEYTTVAAPSLGAKNFNLSVAAGKLNPDVSIVTAIPATNGLKTSTTDSGRTYDYDFGIENFGRTLKIYYKDNGAAKLTVYAVEDMTKDVVITSNMTAAQVKSAFAAAGITANVGANSITKIQNGVQTATTNSAVTLGTTKGSDAGVAGTYFVTGNPAAVYAVKLADENVKVVSQVTAYKAPTEKATGNITLVGVTAAGEIGTTANITLQKVGSDTADVVELYDGIKKDDYVYVTKIVAGKGIMKVEKADVIEGATVSGFASGKATINGSAYTALAAGDISNSVTANASNIAALNLVAHVTAGDVGATKYNYVLTSDGKLLGRYAYTAAESANTYAQVLQVQFKEGSAANLENPDTTYAKVLVKVLLTDGTTDVYTFTSTKKISALKDAGTGTGIDSFYEEIQQLTKGTYTEHEATEANVLAKGDVIKFAVSGKNFSEMKKVAEDAAYASAKIDAGKALVVAGKYLSSSTPIIYQDLSDLSKAPKLITGYTGTQDVAAANAFFVTDASGNLVCVFANKLFDTKTTATTIAYVAADIAAPSSTKYDSALSKTVYGYDVYVDGVKTTLWSENSSLTVSAGFLEYTMTDNYLTAMSNTITGYSVVAKDTVNYVDSANVDIGGTQYPIGTPKYITDDTANSNGVSAGGSLTKDLQAIALYKTSDTSKTLVYVAIINA